LIGPPCAEKRIGGLAGSAFLSETNQFIIMGRALIVNASPFFYYRFGNLSIFDFVSFCWMFFKGSGYRMVTIFHT